MNSDGSVALWNNQRELVIENAFFLLVFEDRKSRRFSLSARDYEGKFFCKHFARAIPFYFYSDEMNLNLNDKLDKNPSDLISISV